MEPTGEVPRDLAPIGEALAVLEADGVRVGERTLRRWLARGQVARHEPARVDGRAVPASARGGRPRVRVSVGELRAFVAGRLSR